VRDLEQGSAAQLALAFDLDAPATPPQPLSSARALTEEQELAVARRHGSLLLAAGAGSGKTSVLVERFVRAVLEDGLAPSRILAITFTERAAGELKERIRARFAALGAREAARDIEAAFIGTFHGFCARLLRTHPLLAGLDPEFTVLDEPHAGRLRVQAFSASLGAFVARPGSAEVDLLAAYSADRVRAMVLGVYAQLRSHGHSHPTLPAVSEADLTDAVDVEGARACALLDALLQGFSARYAALKRERSALDFDDLELRARLLLEEHPEVRASWSERLELLAVDEFQDTSPRQLAILNALERDNLFTVGDELQSIYGFRHAEVGLFRARRALLAERGASLALTYNFRSRPPLLAAINAVFAARFAASYTPLMAGREEEGEERAATGGPVAAPPTPPRSAGPEAPLELLLTDRRAWNGDSPACTPPGELSAPRWRHAEARLLASRIAELIDAGRARPGEVAVLLRSVGDLPLYQRALEECGLRTLAAVGSFWGHQQVGDLLAYLRALANPLDEVALYSTLASPLVGLSSDALALLAQAAQGAGVSVWDTVRGFVPSLREGLAAAERERLVAAGLLALDHPHPSSSEHEHPVAAEPMRPDAAEPEPEAMAESGRFVPADRERLASFAVRFASERASAASRPLSELLHRALSASGYEHYVLSLPWGERRLANIHKLQRLALRYEAQEGRDLRGFLAHIAHQQEEMEGAEPEAPAGELEPEAVRLLSIHAAKGLEFPVVCLADLGRVPPTSAPSLLVDGPRVGLRLARLDGSAPVPCLDYSTLLQERRQAEAEEEDRILYVAMTRARDLLVLSGAVDFERWPFPRPGSSAQSAPIAWLGPALLSDLPACAAALGSPVQVHAVSGAPHEAVHPLLFGAPRPWRVRCRGALSLPGPAGPHHAAPLIKKNLSPHPLHTELHRTLRAGALWLQVLP
jgi:ATP-dependent exoDNAse (exonuclease V) beta subunit